jgi:hypothetical protein
LLRGSDDQLVVLSMSKSDEKIVTKATTPYNVDEPDEAQLKGCKLIRSLT